MGSSDTAVAVVVFMCVLIVGWCAVIGKFCKEGWGREGSLLNPSRAVDVREVRRGLLSGGRNPALDAAHGGAGGKQEVGALGLAKGLSPAETARKQAQRAARAEATTGSPAPMKSSSGNSVVDVVNPVRQAPAGPEVDIEQPKPRVQNPMMVVEQAVAEQPPKKDKKPHKLSKKEQKKAAAAAAKAQTDAEATKAQADAEVALQVLVQEREAAAEAVESLRTAVGAAKKKKVKAGLQEELNQAETRLQRALVAAPLRPASEHVQEEPAVGSREWEDKIRAKLDARDAENRRLGAEKKGRKALIHDKERVLIALDFTHVRCIYVSISVA
jgi:hypothetical protein